MFEFLLPHGLLDGDPLNWFVVIDPATLEVPTSVGAPHAASDGAATRIVIFDAFEERPVSLDFYAADFGYNGSMMHNARRDALEECESMFGARLGTWTPIPHDVDHLESFVLQHVAETYGQRR